METIEAADGENPPPDDASTEPPFPVANLMDQLFTWHLEEILKEIFLGLDAESLKNARLVNSEWNNFIRDRIWDCKWTRTILRERLWNNFVPSRRSVVVRGSTTSMCCDNGLVICGFTDGSATVYDVSNERKIVDLDDRKDAVLYCSTQVGLTSVMAVTSCAGTEMSDDWQDGVTGRYFSLALWSKDDWSLLRRFEDKEIIKFSAFTAAILVRLKTESYLWTYDCTTGPALLPAEKDGMRLSVSEDDWSAGWNGTAITVARPPDRLLTFPVRSVAALKLAVAQQVLLAATTDRKLLVLDLAAPGGRCIRVLTSKTAVTDIRTNGTVVGLVMADLSLRFLKLNQLTDTRISDERLWTRSIQLDIPRSLYVGPLTSINTTCLLACAKGSCQIELYDFWHNPPRQPAPSLIKVEQPVKTGPSSGEAADDAVCENCIRKIVKSLAASPARGRHMRPIVEAGDRMAENNSGPDSVCLLPDMK